MNKPITLKSPFVVITTIFFITYVVYCLGYLPMLDKALDISLMQFMLLSMTVFAIGYMAGLGEPALTKEEEQEAVETFKDFKKIVYKAIEQAQK